MVRKQASLIAVVLNCVAFVGCAGLPASEQVERVKEQTMIEPFRYLAVIEITVSHLDWIAEYESKIDGLIGRHGGRRLARTSDAEQIEGRRKLPDGVAIVGFPSRENFESFYTDPDYLPLRESRMQGPTSEFLLVPLADPSFGTKK